MGMESGAEERGFLSPEETAFLGFWSSTEAALLRLWNANALQTRMKRPWIHKLCLQCNKHILNRYVNKIGILLPQTNTLLLDNSNIFWILPRVWVQQHSGRTQTKLWSNWLIKTTLSLIASFWQQESLAESIRTGSSYLAPFLWDLCHYNDDEHSLQALND